ncbi:MAG: efflux RND transporter periplasmic adaptor subunit [Gammaproteobacteria bacterium]|nr:efflux RND transporter periplasmic adaptor subunit [Gammaproteobacteria bacterium]
MKKTLVGMVLIVVAFAAGLLVAPMVTSSKGTLEQPEQATDGEPEILYWVAPMDPNFKRDQPGKSPMGMDLVPVYANASGGDGVTINPQVENNLGVRTARAEVRPLWRRIEATGYVDFDETRISHINTRVTGWIVNLGVEAEGEKVARGDLLFEFYSPELVNAQKEYLSALRRNRDLLLDGAEDKLRALGMRQEQVRALAKNGVASENVSITAPQDGIVTSLSVREGMYVQPNTPIMSLADLSSVWLQAEVFESQAGWVAEGQDATATLDYMPGVEFTGQVDYVYPVLDAATRTLRVRLQFDNPDRRLKPNMYAQVTLYGRLKPNALTIPREALIPAPGHDRVVRVQGDGEFEVSEVMTGLESGEHVEILAGLSEGDRVVTSAQFLIDSEASISGSIRRLDADPDPVDRRSLERVFASGRVEEVDRESLRVRISHGPIDALGWPAMNMMFDSVAGLDLADVARGQNVRFGLLQQPSGEYVLEHIHLGAGAGLETEGDSAGHHSHAAPEPEPGREITAMAVVHGVMADDRVLKLEHEPIPELGWPAMTMNFDVAADVPLNALGEGAEIHFTMRESAQGGWVIHHIHVMTPASAPGGHDHD